MELVGWFSALALLLTVFSQVFAQWRSGSTKGVSHWMFIGQLVTSAGFVIYSADLGNWVFVVSNALTLCAALVGQYVYLRNCRGSKQDATTRGTEHSVQD